MPVRIFQKNTKNFHWKAAETPGRILQKKTNISKKFHGKSTEIPGRIFEHNKQITN